MTTKAAITETTEALVKRFVEETRRPGGVDAASETKHRLVKRLREEGVLDERMIQHLILSFQPGGEEEILPGETRADAVARLMRHYGWDERTAEFTISLSQGWSDIVPEDDEGNPLPYFHHRDDEDLPEPDDGSDQR